MSTDKRFDFFYEHATSDHATTAQRAEIASQLADAEETATRRGWYVATVYDHDDCGDPDDDGETARAIERGELERLIVMLCNDNGSVMEALGGVIVASEDDPYVRVVAAEMTSELLATHQECHARTTCGGCGRAWCGECDPAPSALCHWCHGRGWSTAEMDAADEYEGTVTR